MGRTFHNEENGWAVLKVKAKGHGDLVTASCFVPYEYMQSRLTFWAINLTDRGQEEPASTFGGAVGYLTTGVILITNQPGSLECADYPGEECQPIPGSHHRMT